MQTNSTSKIVSVFVFEKFSETWFCTLMDFLFFKKMPHSVNEVNTSDFIQVSALTFLDDSMPMVYAEVILQC